MLRMYSEFAGIDVSIEDIVSEKGLGNRFSIIGEQPEPRYIMPGFLVDLRMLVVKNTWAVGRITEIRGYISHLTGQPTSRFATVSANVGRHCIVVFQDLKDSMAFWRAAEYCPFKGHLLDIEVFSPTFKKYVPYSEEPIYRLFSGTHRPRHKFVGRWRKSRAKGDRWNWSPENNIMSREP
jgi:hypothetical protein